MEEEEENIKIKIKKIVLYLYRRKFNMDDSGKSFHLRPFIGQE